MLTWEELVNATFRRRLEAKPEWPKVYCQELYCLNVDCPVREVAVDVKLEDDAHPPKSLKCPCCKRVMKHHGYIEYDMVLGCYSSEKKKGAGNVR